MFHMSNDSGLFRTAGDLREASAERDVNRWIEPDGTVWLPLYEAKMIHQYNHRFGDYRTMDLQSGRGVRQLKRPEVSELMNTEYEPQPRYWVNAENVQKRLDKKEWKHHWLMGWREITSGLDERTVIASFIPKAGCGNKLVLVMPSISPNWAALLLACMNSIVFDYIARQKLGGTSLNVYIMKQIACPIPSFFSQKQRYHLLDNVLRLSCTSFSLTSLASDVGFDDSPFVFDSEYRHLLMAEIDAIMLYAYGLAIDEIRYILDPKDVMSDDYPSETFRILQRNEIERYGEYRTRRLILEAWDRFWADGTFTEREGVENVLPSAA
jgi:hypothetical protein